MADETGVVSGRWAYREDMTWDTTVVIGADLLDQLDGLFAWDNGCVDSGIHDEALRLRVRPIVEQMSPESRRRAAVDLYGTPTRRTQGYSNEDVDAFLAWLDNGCRLP